MTSILYDEIFSQFLGNIDEYDFASYDEQDVEALMIEYLHKSLADPYIRKLFSSSILDDQTKTLTYTMDFVINDDEDNDFVIDVLAKGMVIAWLSPQVRSRLNIAQVFGTKESKFYSQSSHLEQLRSLLHDTKLELRKLVRSRAYSYTSFIEE